MRDNDPCRIHEPALAALDELDELALDSDAVEAARAHLAQCPRCQARRLMWARLDSALRDALDPTAAIPALSTADLLAAIGADHEPSERRTPMLSVIYMRDEDIMDDEHISATPSTQTSDAPITTATGSGASTRNFAPLPTLKPDHQMGWRRALTGLVAVAVVITLLGSITGVMALTGHLHGPKSSTASKLDASATQTAQAQPAFPQQTQIAGIAFTSSTDGWVVFRGGNGNGLFYHYQSGRLVKSFTMPQGGFGTATLWPFAPNNIWAFDGQVYHYDGANWTQQTFPAPPNSEGIGRPYVVTMASPTQGWAIGNTFIQSSGAQYLTQVFYHYDGSMWRLDPADKQASEGAPGGRPEPTPASQTQDGPAVSNPQIQITGISATPGGDVWATGYAQGQDANGNPTDTTGYLYHRAGGVWHVAQTLPGDVLSGIVMTGPNSGWIIGQYVRVKIVGGNIAPYKVTQIMPIVLKWNGASWAPSAIPQPDQTQGGMTINQIAAASPSNVWVIGNSNGMTYTAGSAYASEATYLIHYDGAHWARANLPQIAAVDQTPGVINQVSFSSISLTPSGDLWIAGQLSVVSNGHYQAQPLLYRYSSGQWTNIPLPAIKPTGGTPSSGSQPAG